MMYKSQFSKMDPYGFVVQGHILFIAAVEVMRPWRGCGRGGDAAVEWMRPWR